VLRLVLPAAVAGGIIGTLAGFTDIALLSLRLNLLDSDNAAAWRENRSWVVLLNAGCFAVLGALAAAGRR
jgi:hypothetical protein